MIREVVETRGLAAVRFVDAVTGLAVTEPLTVSAPGVRWSRNRQGWLVVRAAPGVDPETGEAEVGVGDAPIELTVADPALRYLPRRFTLSFPRDPDPRRADRDDSRFRPADARLFRSPAARVAPGWGVIRATVEGDAEGERLAGALLRVFRGGDTLALGLSDARGEALVAVPGIPITTWEEGPGPVLATEIDARVEVIWDPEAGPLPDPDDLEDRRGPLRVRRRNVTLASGRELVMTL